MFIIEHLITLCFNLAGLLYYVLNSGICLITILFIKETLFFIEKVDVFPVCLKLFIYFHDMNVLVLFRRHNMTIFSHELI